MKICSKCGIEKQESEFSLRKDTGGLRGQCTECAKAYKRIYDVAHKEERAAYDKIYNNTHKEEKTARDKIYCEKHKEERAARQKIYNDAHKEERASQRKTHYEAHKEENAARCKAYRETHKEEERARHKIYNETHKEKIRERNRECKKNRRHRDANFRMACNLRIRTGRALKSGQKSGSAVKDLCCSIPELRIHLESKFRDGMNWDNYGAQWEIDHIKPLSSFDLTDRAQFLEACNYKNLQPLLVHENRSKGAKFSKGAK